jgi:hypothetical protein
MPWVKFSKNFNWSPNPSITYAYKADMVLLVTTECANAAIENGAAEKIKKPGSERRSNGIAKTIKTTPKR